MNTPNPADEAIAELIEDLARKASRCNFRSEEKERQTYIDQIAQLRASMNPTIIQKVKH